ncbi:MAG: hypothetical protein A2359_02355 [Candidatus Moranbacteria bacterium RIFOXYB1_FULL_43_19]|nr:MAG: hypothetical protein A2359_02355 [Candidatus Moranbacteria bacterium RIFOXYB1_FULL_43_19]OGI33565.1 MAG: hypothetical protein A2420_00400 [Candidatus Moranbacteria bacterium RIFOXYC1_FULL_44_13]OGI37540.1 MAG: hypothetical protein A2612_05405 [Candidatus Moranbacteria bacterium RIFOXYD1_FULL_44_12]
MKKIFLFALAFVIPVLVFAQDSSKKKAYYFYGEQCPHCKNVDEYFQANGIHEKYDITKLEFSNPFNARLLMKFGEKFNSEFKGSVPAIAFADKFIVGDQPIIDNFVREIDLAENANVLPDAGNAENANENDTKQESQPVRNENGNKKSIFPVLIFALVLVGGGALVYLNRKKT